MIIQEQKHEGIEYLVAHPQADQVSEKTPLILVHGAYNNGEVWRTNIMPYFVQRGYSVYAIHLKNRNQWRNKSTLFSYTLSSYVKKLAKFMDHVGKSSILIGHSMGGLVVQKYLSDYQHQVKGFCLMAAVAPYGTKNTIKMMFANPVMLLRYTMLTLNPSIAQKYPPSHGLLSARSDAETRSNFQNLVMRESATALLNTFHPSVNIKKVKKTPVLVLGAANDNLILAKDIIKTGELYDNPAKLYPEMGHFMILEPDWELVAKDVEDWILRLIH